MVRSIFHYTLAVLALLLAFSAPANAGAEPSRIFLHFEGEDDTVLAALEAMRGGFEAILLASDNVELVTPDAMAVVVTECVDNTDKGSAAARQCLFQAAHTLEVEQLLSINLVPLDDISFELVLEVWKPKKNTELFASRLALDATSVEAAARSGLALLAMDYLCFRETGKACPSED